MALTIKNESNGGGYESLPVGQYKAACYRIVDVGTHNETYEGETSKRHSVFIYWETPDNKMSDGKPFSIMKQYTLSLNEKSALFRDLCSWRKKKFTDEELKGFDLTNILGCTCEIEVELTSGGNPKVTAVYYPEGGVQKIATVNEQLAFDVDEYAKTISKCAISFLSYLSGYKIKWTNLLKWLQLTKLNHKSMRKKEVKIFLLLILWQTKVLSPRKISRFDGLGCWVRI
jgi:hypothetical protein